MSKYQAPGKISRDVVKAYFSERGYTVESLGQLWRHLTGRLTRGDQSYFVKIAMSEPIGGLTSQEASWYQQVGRRLEKADQSFTVPTLYETGKLTFPDGSKRFFYVSEFIESSPLATKYPPKLRDLASWIERIADATMFIQCLKGIELHKPNDKPPAEKVAGYLRIYKQWMAESDYDLSDVMTLASELPRTYWPGSNHGDFVPWHMLERGSSFVLIDAEHASLTKPRYYDVAYFYHRVYTAAESPELAKAYLRAFTERLSEGEQEKFNAAFRAVLAGRVIGGYWDLKQERRFETPYHASLRRDLLQGTLL